MNTAIATGQSAQAPFLANPNYPARASHAAQSAARGRSGYRLHPNGGGLVANTAHVDPSVYLGPMCEVHGYAQLKDAVRVSGRAHISGDRFPGGVSTLIEDEVLIFGDVKISGCVLIRNQVDIRGEVVLEGCVSVMHHARLFGQAHLSGDVQVMESAVVCGSTRIVSPNRRVIIRGEHYLTCGDMVEDLADCEKRRRRAMRRPLVLESVLS